MVDLGRVDGYNVGEGDGAWADLLTRLDPRSLGGQVHQLLPLAWSL